MEKLGINGVQLLAQLVNIGVLVLVLKKFLYRPVLDMLSKRQSEIESGLQAKTEAEKKLKSLEEKERELNKKARVTAEKAISDAKKEAQKEVEQILAKAREDAKKLKQEARQEAEGYKKQMTKKMEDEVIKSATKLANEALEKLLSADAQTKITEAQVKKLTKA